jgi:hypothetical protein
MLGHDLESGNKSPEGSWSDLGDTLDALPPQTHMGDHGNTPTPHEQGKKYRIVRKIKSKHRCSCLAHLSFSVPRYDRSFWFRQKESLKWLLGFWVTGLAEFVAQCAKHRPTDTWARPEETASSSARLPHDIRTLRNIVPETVTDLRTWGPLADPRTLRGCLGGRSFAIVDLEDLILLILTYLFLPLRNGVIGRMQIETGQGFTTIRRDRSPPSAICISPDAQPPPV